MKARHVAAPEPQAGVEAVARRAENRACADCGGAFTRFASVTLGTFLCNRCYGLHRKVGAHVSRTKCVGLDTWRAEDVAAMAAVGNRRANDFWEFNVPLTRPRPRPDSPDDFVETWIRDKYEKRLFCPNNSAPPGKTAPNHTQSRQQQGAVEASPRLHECDVTVEAAGNLNRPSEGGAVGMQTTEGQLSDDDWVWASPAPFSQREAISGSSLNQGLTRGRMPAAVARPSATFRDSLNVHEIENSVAMAGSSDVQGTTGFLGIPGDSYKFAGTSDLRNSSNVEFHDMNGGETQQKKDPFADLAALF